MALCKHNISCFRYQTYKHMMYMHQYGYGHHDPYYNNHYRQGQCYQGCPYNAHCEYGFCECNNGFVKNSGGCYRPEAVPPPRNLEMPFIACAEVAECQNIDINMVCQNQTTGGNNCACRTDFKWNPEKSECEFYLNVDCSNITYETPVSPVVDTAANATLTELEQPDKKILVQDLEKKTTITADEALETSMLSNIDPQVASENDIKEAFCRDVDSFSWELGKYEDVEETSYEFYYVLAFIAVVVGGYAFYKYYYKKRRQNNKREDNSDNIDENNLNNVNAMPLADQPGGITPNPGFQPHPTPSYQPPPAAAANLPYPVYPPSIDPTAAPEPIPPTQPGYTNVYPPLSVNLPAEGAVNSSLPPYTPPASGGALPYPVAPNNPTFPPYPTQNQPPYNPSA